MLRRFYTIGDVLVKKKLSVMKYGLWVDREIRKKLDVLSISNL